MDNSAWNLSSPEQWLSLLGSVIILGAYFLTVAKPEKKILSFYISIMGGVLLFMVAMMYANAGLIFLEISWISINVWGIWRAHSEP